MKHISIRELNTNLCKILTDVVTSGEEIVVTKSGKPYISLRSCKSNLDEVASSHLTKKGLIKDLQSKIDSIQPNLVRPEEIKHYCLACKKENKRIREAIGEFDIIDNDIFDKAWLCAEHKTKRGVLV